MKILAFTLGRYFKHRCFAQYTTCWPKVHTYIIWLKISKFIAIFLTSRFMNNTPSNNLPKADTFVRFGYGTVGNRCIIYYVLETYTNVLQLIAY